MKNIKFFKSKKNTKLKLFIAVFFSILMVASIFGVLATNNNSSLNTGIHNDSSTNIPSGCTSDISIPTSYFVNNAVSNSGTSTIDLPVYENSSESAYSFSDGMSTSGSDTSSNYEALSSASINGYFWSGSTINPTLSIPAIGYSGVSGTVVFGGYSVGTVTVTITAPNGDT